MTIDANGEKESPDENKGIEEGVLGERQSSNPVSALNVDAANQSEKHGATSGLQGPSILQVQQQQQTQGSVVCWERFLHVRSIRVLLVENDDSTRHVVTALLRNCNYEVLEAANGLQAWKVLEDLTNHVDIVLTEVVMPVISGIGLLCKIMSHKTRKNIPVIMMSSHDSMGLVFKCLSKGAVDFLVKPIRKNELKNLWQHVWRRCHSVSHITSSTVLLNWELAYVSSGSGSESGTQTQKSVKSKGSSGNSASDDGENDASNGINVGDGSDDGSGAQSSWTKQAVEVDSSQALSPMDQVAECQDSTCAQVIRSNAEHSDNKKEQLIAAKEGHVQKRPDDAEKGNDLETIVHKHVEPKSENPEGQTRPTGREFESTRELANKLEFSNNATDSCKEPNVELSLKRLRGVQDTGRSVPDDRYVLRRSEQSAFSRYNTSTNIFKAPNGVTGSSSVLDNSIEVAKRESVGDMHGYFVDHIVYQSSNGVSNNIDMGSSTNKLPKDKSEATSAINGLHPSAFRPVKNDLRYSQQQVSLLPNGMQSTDICPGRGSHQDIQIQHTHHQNYHHHHHHHFQNLENQPSSNIDESSSKKLVVDAPHCGSTNVLGGPMDGNPRNYSLNRSASGSNHGSNGQNGSSTAVNAVGNNAESDVGQGGKSGSGDASGSGSGNRVDENKHAQREAALIKFRQKRKERCFKKKESLRKNLFGGWTRLAARPNFLPGGKRDLVLGTSEQYCFPKHVWSIKVFLVVVRYQNRKKLAEQRPRVRGQFVKQTGTDSSARSGDE
ncbi:UNVERIFIED_CONTAM: Two-component response regulator-like APRR7 [Sesamum radiatum]|uniref:Two-component response regulator-like APRR7 n=1 Tax=Sesamum radiatum TaxID=300843 RepID=A0AAW2KRY4_SESRA